MSWGSAEGGSNLASPWRIACDCSADARDAWEATAWQMGRILHCGPNQEQRLLIGQGEAWLARLTALQTARE